MAHQYHSQRDALTRLFRRCVECPPDLQPTCPVCSDGYTCSLKPQSCDYCASMECVKIDQFPGQAAPAQSTPIGGIVGGVIGGVIGIIGITYLVWHFCIRKKKRRDLWVPPEKTARPRSQVPPSRTHSIASTVMTRASNVIQIAYIPGVTVRSPPETPEIAPPMPSVPSTYAGTSTHTTPDIEQHFFMPKDLRDSVWSDTSSMMTDPRISIAPSLARASVADTIYQENAVPAIPAQYAYRAQANAVSVRSGNSTPSIAPSENIPAIPQMPKAITLNGNSSSIVARNVVARPIELKKPGSSKAGASLSPFPRKTLSRRATPVPTISDEKEVVFSSPSSNTTSAPLLTPDSSRLQQTSYMSLGGVSGISELPAESPGAESIGGSSTTSTRPTTAYAEAMIHEAMMRAAADASHPGARRPDLPSHDSGPFSDANEIR